MTLEVKFGKEYAKKVHDEAHGWYYGKEYYGSLTINNSVMLCYEYNTSCNMRITLVGKGICEYGKLTKRADGSIDAKEDIRRMISTNENIKNLVRAKAFEKLDNLCDVLISNSDSFD